MIIRWNHILIVAYTNTHLFKARVASSTTTEILKFTISLSRCSNTAVSHQEWGFEFHLATNLTLSNIHTLYTWRILSISIATNFMQNVPMCFHDIIQPMLNQFSQIVSGDVSTLHNQYY